MSEECSLYDVCSVGTKTNFNLTVCDTALTERQSTALPPVCLEKKQKPNLMPQAVIDGK